VTACPKMLEHSSLHLENPVLTGSYVIMALIYIVARGGKSEKE